MEQWRVPRPALCAERTPALGGYQGRSEIDAGWRQMRAVKYDDAVAVLTDLVVALHSDLRAVLCR